jgi:hypothetical protein
MFVKSLITYTLKQFNQMMIYDYRILNKLDDSQEYHSYVQEMAWFFYRCAVCLWISQWHVTGTLCMLYFRRISLVAFPININAHSCSPYLLMKSHLNVCKINGYKMLQHCSVDMHLLLWVRFSTYSHKLIGSWLFWSVKCGLMFFFTSFWKFCIYCGKW